METKKMTEKNVQKLLTELGKESVRENYRKAVMRVGSSYVRLQFFKKLEAPDPIIPLEEKRLQDLVKEALIWKEDLNVIWKREIDEEIKKDYESNWKNQ